MWQWPFSATSAGLYCLLGYRVASRYLWPFQQSFPPFRYQAYSHAAHFRAPALASSATEFLAFLIWFATSVSRNKLNYRGCVYDHSFVGTNSFVEVESGQKVSRQIKVSLSYPLAAQYSIV